MAKDAALKMLSYSGSCVRVAPSTSTVPAEHGWFMHRPCKSAFFGSTPKAGLSAEGKLRGGYTTLPLDGRGCANQTNWTRSSTEERRSSKPEVCGFNSHRVRL